MAVMICISIACFKLSDPDMAFPHLVLLRSLLAQCHDCGHADREVEAAHIVDPCLLDKVPDLWLFEMLNLIVVRGGQISTHAAIMPGDDDTAAASGCILINQILGMDTSLPAGIEEKFSIFVLAHAANVHD